MGVNYANARITFEINIQGKFTSFGYAMNHFQLEISYRKL